MIRSTMRTLEGGFITCAGGGSIGRKLSCLKGNRYTSVRYAGLIWSRKISGSPGKKDRCSAVARIG
ncbi:MAG: hypothetical protein LZF60_80134 [Nitrospira sp.]|nr:MAG: hypothetical protein LZF60_80134 [Nitrospira sp.]